MDRIIAERIFSRYLSVKKVHQPDSKFAVKRLDFNRNFTVISDNKKIGTCEYDSITNRYCKFKATKFNNFRKSQATYTMMDYLKAGKFVIKR